MFTSNPKQPEIAASMSVAHRRHEAAPATADVAARAAPAERAVPLGVLDFSDVPTLLTAFGSGDPLADHAARQGSLDSMFGVAYLGAFGSGRPRPFSVPTDAPPVSAASRFCTRHLRSMESHL